MSRACEQIVELVKHKIALVEALKKTEADPLMVRRMAARQRVLHKLRLLDAVITHGEGMRGTTETHNV